MASEGNTWALRCDAGERRWDVQDSARADRVPEVQARRPIVCAPASEVGADHGSEEFSSFTDVPIWHSLPSAWT
jgi:hypothetical protein